MLLGGPDLGPVAKVLILYLYTEPKISYLQKMTNCTPVLLQVELYDTSNNTAMSVSTVIFSFSDEGNIQPQTRNLFTWTSEMSPRSTIHCSSITFTTQRSPLCHFTKKEHFMNERLFAGVVRTTQVYISSNHCHMSEGSTLEV